MTELLRQWILNITGASMLTGAALSLAPKGAVKKVLSLLCGLVMISALMSIGTDFDYTKFSLYLSEYRSEAEKIAEDASEQTDRLHRLVIEQETEAYILDKCESGGAHILSVEVAAKWSDEGYWYPVSAEIVYDGTDENTISVLSGCIEGELGIPKNEQIWSRSDEK